MRDAVRKFSWLLCCSVVIDSTIPGTGMNRLDFIPRCLLVARCLCARVFFLYFVVVVHVVVLSLLSLSYRY